MLPPRKGAHLTFGQEGRAKPIAIFLVAFKIPGISIMPMNVLATDIATASTLARFFLFTAEQAAEVGVHIRPQLVMVFRHVPQQTGPTPFPALQMS